jgi:selT/selW/selH-like putative selenoprotein
VAAEVKSNKGLEVELVRGSGGIFEVRQGDSLVFDKKSAQRFPDEGEISRLLT